MEQQHQPEKKPQPVPGFPAQTLEEIKADLRKQFPNLTEAEIESYLSPSRDTEPALWLGQSTQKTRLN